MEDKDLDRKLPRTWKEYLQSSQEMKEAIGWVYKEFISSRAKSLTKKTFACMIGVVVFGALMPFSMSFVLNGLARRDLYLVLGGLFGYGFIHFLRRPLIRWQYWYRMRLSDANNLRLRTRVVELFLNKAPIQYISDDEVLDHSNIKTGYQKLGYLQSLILYGGIEPIFSLIVSYVALWFLDWKMIAPMATFILILYIVWSIFLNQQTMFYAIPLEKRWREHHRYFDERAKHPESVKNKGMEDYEVREIARQYNEIIIPTRQFWDWFDKNATVRGMVGLFVLFLIVATGIYRHWNGVISLGLLLPLVSWAEQFTHNLWRLGDLERELNASTPAIMSLKEALLLPTIFKGPKNITLARDLACRIEFKNVSYRYTNSNHDALKNVSFVIEPGRKVALIGPSGIGKTTIMRLVQNYMDPTAGIIEIDGIDMKNINRQSWVSLVGYIPQQPHIFRGKLRDVLLYGVQEEEKNKIDDDLLCWMMRDFQVNLGHRLEKGLDTEVADIKLSGGQLQRLVICAAAVKNPKLIIADEPTSSLDAITENLLFREGLEKILVNNRSALIITHRLSSVKDLCDQFIVLSAGNDGAGQIEAIGSSFEEIIKISATFRELAKYQNLAIGNSNGKIRNFELCSKGA